MKSQRDLWFCRGFGACLVLALALMLWIVFAQAASAETTTFAFTGGEQTYTVPAGVHSIHVTAVGARGGKGSDGAVVFGGSGGAGDRLEAELAVMPGQVLFIEVGGNGSDGSAITTRGVGGFNGGGLSEGVTRPGGGGGGASDVRTCSRDAAACAGVADTLASRLLVAGGGGGGGGSGRGQQPSGGEGGSAGADGLAGQALDCNGLPPPTPGGGGTAGTQISGGSGGVAGNNGASPGGSGMFGLGAAAIPSGFRTNQLGGGGGGGYFGGGSGGGANGCAAGGGGGGSSFAAPTASKVSLATDSTGVPEVLIAAPEPPKPSNAFRLGKLKRSKRKGTATLTVDLPGPGTLALEGRGLAARQMSVNGAGRVMLPITAKGKAKRALARTGKAKLSARIAFTPTGGDSSRQSLKITLVKTA